MPAEREPLVPGAWGSRDPEDHTGNAEKTNTYRSCGHSPAESMSLGLAPRPELSLRQSADFASHLSSDSWQRRHICRAKGR
ncbi:hypothetical protein ASPTUDRAFT_381455 [Aspergillus tubingensis CBS 134.48]|uniref:Uncharacterized protein n=1 Tax=Aspergillus tubingensis (strain CBS 134.48) TaxID=767770 RepID=A0A1L9NHC7_ASPTC|nr:hypothetical protein ASPTUDRAFT_381455 [Aspergillus tubingensis CBS 134.48]